MPSKTDALARRSTLRRVVLEPADEFDMPHPDQYRGERGEKFRVTTVIEELVQEWTTRNGVREHGEEIYSITLKGPVLTKNGIEHATQNASDLYGNGVWGKRLDRIPEQVQEYLVGKEMMAQ